MALVCWNCVLLIVWTSPNNFDALLNLRLTYIELHMGLITITINLMPLNMHVCSGLSRMVGTRPRCPTGGGGGSKRTGKNAFKVAG